MSALNFDFPRRIAGFGTATAPAATTHNIALPSRTEFTEGLLIIISVCFDGGPGTVTWPAGWTELLNVSTSDDSIPVSPACRLQIYYRVSDGTESGNVTLTTTSSEEMQASVSVFERHSSSTNPPEIAHDSSRTGTSTAPNPPLLTPTGGSQNYTWVEVFGANEGNLDSTPFSANWPDGLNARSSTSGGECMICETRLRSAASSMDPGVMGMSAGAAWIAATIAIYPGMEGVRGYPEITDVVTSTTAVAATSHTVSLPNYSAGDLLIVEFATDGVPTFTWPAGWTALVADFSISTNARVGVRYRIADGTEGTSIAMTTSASEEAVGIAVAITGHDPARAPQSVTTTGTGTGYSVVLVTTEAPDDILWLGGGVGDTATHRTLYAGYAMEDVAGLQSSAGAGACTSMMGYRNTRGTGGGVGLDKASQNVGFLLFNGSVPFAAWAAAIFPGGLVIPPGSSFRRRGPSKHLRPAYYRIPRIAD